MSEKKSAATVIVEMLESDHISLIRDQYGEPFLILPADFVSDASDASDAILGISYPSMLSKNKEVTHRIAKIASSASLASLIKYPVNTENQDLLNIISRRYYKQEGKAVGSEPVKSALRIVSGRDSPRFKFWNRVGLDADGSWWLDLGNGSAVWIDENGWIISGEPKIYFRHYTHQLPLYTPTHEGEGDLFSLLDFVNLPDVDSQLLYIVAAVCTLIPDFPHPIIYLYGGQGTFKSSAMAVVKEVFDRSVVGLLKLQDDVNQLSQNLDHHWVAFFDNVSTISEAQSDTLSRACTGSGISKRGLYTNDSDHTRWYRSCVGLNGIGLVADKPDLTNRAIILETKPVPESLRKTDREVQAGVSRCAGMALGDALNLVVAAKKLVSNGFKVNMPRMADFAQWGAAVTVAMGLPVESFINAYKENIRDTEVTIAKGNVIGGLLIDYLEAKLLVEKEVSFTSHQIYTILRSKAEESNYNMKQDFPGDPRWLSNKIRELAPILPAAGFVVRFKRTGKERTITFSKFNQTRLDNPEEIQPLGKNSWSVEDLRELRCNLKTLRGDFGGVEVIKTVAPEAVVSEPVGLQFAREAFLNRAELRGDGLEMSIALEFLGKLGLNVSLSVKLVASMMRDGVIFSPRPGWYRVT